MARRTHLTRKVVAEYDITVEDVIEFIEDCNEEEKIKIKEQLHYRPKKVLNSDNLYDDLRIGYLKEIFDKYSLDELRQLAKDKLAIH